MNWTNEQLLAINKKDCNILVSAGAGSGKTAILSERVIRILNDGHNINELLILTFTNAASVEMKERIRKKIIQRGLTTQLDLLDSSYITTFDSFALSVVRTYHYLIGVNKNISITDQSILDVEKYKIISEVLKDRYEKDINCNKLVEFILRKGDSSLVEGIKELLNKIELEIDVETYFNNCFGLDINKYFDKVYYDYMNLICSRIKEIENIIYEMEDSIETKEDEDLVALISNIYSPLFVAREYNEIKNFYDGNNKMPQNRKNITDTLLKLRSKITKINTEITKYLIYPDKDFIKSNFIYSKEMSLILLDIVKEVYYKYDAYKKENNIYSFMDIAKLAINIFKNNPSVANKIKDSLHEIMVDEYQDTSSLQEEFISYISSNNLYMVGDIKQSIYRFRYANPSLFKNKYDKYKNNDGGFLIDLNKNFRSRKEVLKNINEIFSLVMNDDLGGANYKKHHMIEYGSNTLFIDDPNQDNNLSILNYNSKDFKGFNINEIEAFIVANDIKNKINNKYKVCVKGECLREVKYSDFTVLVDKRSGFDTYKKVFEFMNIPTVFYKKENLLKQDDMLIFSNSLKLIYAYCNENYDSEFIHCFYSVSRSYLFEYSDDEIFKMIINKDFKNNRVYNALSKIIDGINELSIFQIFTLLIENFDWYNKLLIKGDIISSKARLTYLLDLANGFDNLNYDFSKLINYLDVVIEKELEINLPESNEGSDAVTFMTIHNSKGLEFPICYFIGFSNKFNLDEIKDTYIFTNNGVILPFINDNIKYPNIERFGFKNSFLNDDVSEKIRLLYVSLTRAKEKMIMVTDLHTKACDSLNNANKFNDFLTYILSSLNRYIIDVDPNDLYLNNQYKFMIMTKSIENNYVNKEYKNLNINTHIKEKKKYSKDIKEEVNNEVIELGNYLHDILFKLDFKNPDYSIVKEDYKYIISRFINSSVLDINNCNNIYKEHEFIEGDSNGIIDLICEYDNEFRIIDYKLSNIDDDAYYNQLLGYKKHLEKIVNKPINLYLYSLFKGDYKKIDN